MIKGNSGILKCEMPSFVADFLQIVAWVDETDNSYVYTSKADHGQEIFLAMKFFQVSLIWWVHTQRKVKLKRLKA